MRNLHKKLLGEVPFTYNKGGKGASGPSAAQIEAEEAQKKELADLTMKEEARTKAMGRKRRGRASLLSGEETGLKQTLGS